MSQKVDSSNPTENYSLEKPIVSSSLSINNPILCKIAKKMNWSPETLITKVRAALPSVIEQEIYLSIAEEISLRPESAKILFRAFLGKQELSMTPNYEIQPSTTRYHNQT